MRPSHKHTVHPFQFGTGQNVSVANGNPYTQRIEKYFRITAQRDYDRDCDRNNRYPILAIDFCY